MSSRSTRTSPWKTRTSAACLRTFGFRTRHGGKNFEAIQPKFVFRLWLNGRTEDELHGLVPPEVAL